MEEFIVNNTDRKVGKFLQIYVGDKPYLLFGKGFDLHGEILKNFLDELKISYPIREVPNFGGLDEHKTLFLPELKGENYCVVGAGTFGKSKEKIFLGEKSGLYQVGPNKQHLEEICNLQELDICIDPIFDISKYF